MTRATGAGLLALVILSDHAFAQADCRSITDSLERLRCYDARFPPGGTAPAKKTPAEDPLIGRAKTAVTKLLRDPASARFDGLKIQTNSAGVKGVCGTINSRNAMGGMTGPKMFVYDGKIARVLVAGEGPEDGTSLGRLVLGVALGEALKIHKDFCKL